MIAVRIFSVLAAAALVAAFAVATFWPPEMPLKVLLAMMDDTWVPTAQAFVQTSLSPWCWANIAQPLLDRPGWLLPTAIGLIFFGGAVSFSGPRGSRTRPRRWRS
ncbi:hypothetical protein [Acidisoma cladoniae]|uniref:hypothetical protein n=1 Tax=Acidisoma cladoniae TaxID=3040935 RepID=UPI00254F5DBD|nr:hypothetical protein [Acidisoma sp. PAMC 29798]